MMPTSTADHERPRARRALRRVPVPAVLQVGRPARHGRGPRHALLNIATSSRPTPKVVILENVRNLIGPRHEHEWDVIIETLRDEGYHVSDQVRGVLAPTAPAIPWAARPRSASGSSSPRRCAPRSVACRSRSSEGLDPVASMTDRFPEAAGSNELFDPRNDWHLEDLLDDAHNIPGATSPTPRLTGSTPGTNSSRSCDPLMEGRHPPGHPIWADAWLDFPEVRRISWDRMSHQNAPQRSPAPRLTRLSPRGSRAT